MSKISALIVTWDHYQEAIRQQTFDQESRDNVQSHGLAFAFLWHHFKPEIIKLVRAEVQPAKDWYSQAKELMPLIQERYQCQSLDGTLTGKTTEV